MTTALEFGFFRTAARQRDARRADGLVNLIELLITACESLRGVAATRRADVQRLLREAAIITKNVRVHDEPALGQELKKPQRGFTGLLAAGEPPALQSLRVCDHAPFQLRAIETVCERRDLFVEAARLRDAARLQLRTRLAVQGFEPLVGRGSIEGRSSVQNRGPLRPIQLVFLPLRRSPRRDGCMSGKSHGRCRLAAHDRQWPSPRVRLLERLEGG